MLRYGRQDVNGKAGDVGHVADPTFHQVRDDGDGSRYLVELGDQNLKYYFQYHKNVSYRRIYRRCGFL